MAVDTTVNIRAKNKTKKAFAAVRSSLGKMRKSLFGTKTAVLALAGVGGFGALTASSLKSADALAKTADQLGITTEALAGLQHAAELTGVQQETLNKSLVKQQKAIFDANRGLETYAQHFETLNLSTERLMELSPDEQFATIADALNKVENQTLKTAIAYDIFGGRGTKLINTLALGSEGLREAKEEAEKLGIAISRVDAASIEQSNDAFTKAKAVMKGVGNTLAISVAPFIKLISDRFVESAVEANGFRDSISSGFETVINIIGVAVDTMQYFEIAWETLKLGATAVLAAIINEVAALDRSFSFFVNKIPGFDMKPSEDLQLWAEVSTFKLMETSDALQALLSAPPPSDALKESLKEAQAEIQLTSEAIAAAKEANRFGDDDQVALDAELSALELQAQSKKELLKQEQALSAAKFNIAKSLTGNLAQLMSSSSKKEFEIGKKFSIANALVKGFEAITSSYAAGAKIGGPILGAAFAASAAVATKVQIDNIRKAQFGGGGSVSVGGGGVATGSAFNGGAPPVAPTNAAATVTGTAQAPGGTTTINLTGSSEDTVSVGLVNQVFDQLQEAIERGDRILFSADSRQGLELTS